MKLRRIIDVGPTLFALGALATAQDASAAASDAADLPARIDAIREQAHLPALGAALVTVDGLEGVWVTGTRRAGGAEKVEPGDIWHLGSCTKSMTATLVALLVARGDLAWDTPLPELLPDVAEDMDDGFRDLTLVELLCHRAGLATAPRMDLFAKMRTSDLPPIELRAMVAYEMLTNPPAV